MSYEDLNNPSVEKRLTAVRALGEDCKAGVEQTEEVNNHVHSCYSFSPYSPTMIAVKGVEAGLRTVGIMDHDSVSGCAEFLEASKAVNIASTVGCEIRVNMDGTSMQGRKTNNPDEPNITYIALHGIPSNQFGAVEQFLKPTHEARIERDRREVDHLNRLLVERGAPTLRFEEDIRSISQAAHGGSITERHILYALSLKLIKVHGKGWPLIDFIEKQMQIPLAENLKEMLLDVDNPHFAYDLLGAFKAALVPDFFLPSSAEECMSVHKAVEFAHEIGAIPAYSYLGDVGESPTGDKKAEKFEDDFLDDLIPELSEIGFQAITYMPPRNIREQLVRLQKLCQANGLMEISGVDINSSRQSFNCPILLEPDFLHLADAAWALIAHEKLTAVDPTLALFSSDNPMASQPLEERLLTYADIGKRMDHTQPEKAIELL